jgi:glycosyltransferase involved in cell wall biosynthesis
VFFTDTEEIPGALPFNFPCFTTHPRSVVAFKDLDDAQMAAYLDAFQQAIDQEVADWQPDVIHGQHVWALPSLAVGKGVPLVLTAHGTDLMGYDKWPEMRHFAETAMEGCVKVICISKDNEALIRKTFPAHVDKIQRMRNGYNPAIFFPQQLDRAEVLGAYGVDYQGQRLALFAGKLTNFKGVDVLLDAAAIIAQKDPDVFIPIAGDGEERANLEAQKAALDLPNVQFLGNVTQDALCRLYNIADVDLVPSRREPFGLVAVEAMACGTPVVATNEGGLPDFVNDSVGGLVPVEDAPALADKILDVLDRAVANPAWRADIQKYAEQNYSQAAIIQELIALYQSVVD